ncbi:MAG: M23 family metallopeptidase, partial [Spirochaetes bacterium]|nr:M23 family metallopeptidase [Spirochaetota bacterium]
RPFIIWTLQRTGGTNLTHRLTERSGLPGTEHEPFNLGRIFGHVTEEWAWDKNADRLRLAMEEICQRRVIIKHCVETVPWEITEALVRASAGAGYRHLFLYRRNALDRLLSLHFAQKTGVWGPNMQKFASLTGAREANPHASPDAAGTEVLAEAVPVEKMVKHEKSCVQILTRTWDALNGLGAKPRAIAYEDIYRTADPEQPAHILLPVLRYLGMSGSDAEDRAWIGDVVGKGDTLSGIAKDYGVSMDTICGSNQLSSYDIIRDGTRLRIPNKDGILYSIQKGQNIVSVVKRYRTSLEKVYGINKIKNFDFIPDGTDIFIPDAKPLNIVPGFLWPSGWSRITSSYGWRRHPINGVRHFHQGMDIRSKYGLIRATKYGKVTYAGWSGGYGKAVIIAHPGGWKSLYGHLSRILVRPGQYVKQGQYIGRSGNTGYSAGPHLHFELINDGRHVNPYRYLKFK